MARKNSAAQVQAPTAEELEVLQDLANAIAENPELGDAIDAVLQAEEAGEAEGWVPRPKYAVTINNAITGAAAPSTGPVLASVGVTTARAGTARAAALAALLASIGQPKNVVLGAVADAEKEWHKSQGRTPGQVSPAGWLRTFAATFA